MLPNKNSSDSSSMNVYDKLRSSKVEKRNSILKTEVHNTSETNDPSSKIENQREEIKNVVQLQDQIEQMKNRLNYIEISKNKNLGVLNTTVKKTNVYVSARSFASQMNKKLQESKIAEEQRAKELKEKVAQFQKNNQQILHEKKEKLMKEKMQIFDQIKKEKLEIKEKLHKAELDTQLKRKMTIEKSNLVKSSSSLMKFESVRKNDSIGQKIRNSSITDFKVHPNVVTKHHNVYENMSDYQLKPVSELKTTLDNLIKEESKKIDELQNILAKQKEASSKLKEITKLKN